MSVVIGVKYNGKVYLGADSQLTRGNNKFSSTNPNNFKIWRVDGIPNMLIGYVGIASNAQFLKAFPPEIDKVVLYEDSLDWTYIVREILPHFYTVLKETGRIGKDDIDMGVELLIAFRDRLYTISQDGTVLEIDDYTAIGSGADSAIGSLDTTVGKSAENRIITAMKNTFKSNAFVDYPIIISDTEKCGFKIISEE